MGNTSGGPYVKCCDALMAEVNVHHAIDIGVSQGDRVPVERPADHNVTVAVTDLTVMLDLSDEGPRAIVERAQLLREGSAAATITRGRDLQPERVVRPLVVVDLPPVVEALLAVRQVPKGLPDEHLVLEGSVEALVLAQRLRMIGPAVAHRHPQTDQPSRKARVERPLMTPGRPVVHDQGLGQPVASEDLGEGRLDRRGPLVRAGLQAHGEPRVIVEHGQRVTALARLHGEVALEVHLPEGIGRVVLEPLPGLALGGLLGVDLPVAPQDLRDRTGRGEPDVTQVEQASAQLAATPGRMLSSQGQNRLLHGVRRAVRTVVGSPAAVFQTGQALLAMTAEPLVARFGADPVGIAQLGKRAVV